MVALGVSLGFPLTLASPEQYNHRHLQRWMMNTVICQSRLPIRIFIVCIKFTEFVK